MRAEVAEAWIAALRSGEYTQTQGHLKYEWMDDVRYCCLGVLCELAIQDGVAVDVRQDGSTVLFNGEEAILPENVQLWAGLKTCTGIVLDSDEDARTSLSAYELSAMNDHGDDFDTIAKVIEENVARL